MTSTAYKITDTITNDIIIADDLYAGLKEIHPCADVEVHANVIALADAYVRGEYVGDYEAYLAVRVTTCNDLEDIEDAHYLIPHYEVTIEDADETCAETYLRESFLTESEARERFEELADDLGEWGEHEVELWIWECPDDNTQCSIECIKSTDC